MKQRFYLRPEATAHPLTACENPAFFQNLYRALLLTLGEQGLLTDSQCQCALEQLP